MNSKIVRIEGTVQNYAWGGKDYIPELLGIKKPGETCAEYWLGAHDNAPSRLSSDELLNEAIRSNVNLFLGESVANKFGRLPYLFKVLDVNDMLSIQVHPTKAEAEKGFQKENELGIDLKAKNRNYKDDNHKPEIMVALSEFWLLHGFLSEEKLLTLLNQTPELSHLSEVFQSEGYKGLYQTVMEESAEQTNKVLRPLIDRVLPLYKAGSLEKASPDYWAAKAFNTFCPEGNLDKGIYSIYFFNIVKVNAGEAVFQDAGIPHAYMEGQNMELMANSDNVLRGGLTPKHVDVPELLKHVVFEATEPNILKGEAVANGMERVYTSPAPDFELSKISVAKDQQYQLRSKTSEIFMIVDGEGTVFNELGSDQYQKGEAFFVPYGTEVNISSENEIVIYRASVPV
ncbi:mannose-6-phosphate isomerase, class I [Reichenbachiella versicolor]|uniref:mannose-6-phosphate isomerase, class I n=1 Tax=Reichenbachiella versicolor TaxID=1821036 RepID=UPI000D6DFCAC|nr:mannose-6-phosphate isomerase, class I [Reichenbachiella versicolor]